MSLLVCGVGLFGCARDSLNDLADVDASVSPNAGGGDAGSTGSVGQTGGANGMNTGTGANGGSGGSTGGTTKPDAGTDKCADSDSDGVCNTNDNCPDAQNADQKDSNGNGRGDVCDPACAFDTLSSTIDTGEVLASAISLNSTGQTLEVAAGETIKIAFDYSLDPCGPSGFTFNHQIMVGFDDGLAPVCAFNGVCGPATGNAQEDLKAPAIPGMYYLLIDVAQQQSCVNAWANGKPDASHRIAAVCVR